MLKIFELNRKAGSFLKLIWSAQIAVWKVALHLIWALFFLLIQFFIQKLWRVLKQTLYSDVVVSAKSYFPSLFPVWLPKIALIDFYDLCFSVETSLKDNCSSS